MAKTIAERDQAKAAELGVSLRTVKTRRARYTHLPMVAAPFAEFTWRYARRLAAEKGRDDTNETEVARVLDDLLTRAEAGPVDKLTDRITGRARVAGAAHRPPARADDTPSETPGTTGQDSRDGPLVTVIPFGVFDADAEAEKWL